MKKQFFPALTGYRAIAAWMIYLYHVWPFKRTDLPPILTRIAANLHIGVDMFFVLSGFLITYRYYQERPLRFGRYMTNRFARIYPMYFLMTLGTFSTAYFATKTWDYGRTLEFITAVTMTKALFSEFFLGGVRQGWTLTLEELFYLSAPLYFILIRRSRRWLYFLPIIIFSIYAALKYLSDVPANTYGFLQVNIHTYIIEFFAGIGLALVISGPGKNFLKTKALTWAGLAVVAAYLLFRGYFAGIFDLKSDIGRFFEMAVLSIFGIAPLLWGLVNERTVISRMLSTKAFVLLGRSSYIFYLIHKGFIFNFFNDYITSNKFIIFIILNLLSIGMFHYIEEPLNGWIRKTIGKKPANG